MTLLNSVENLSIGKYEKPNLKGDWLNILLLIFMYTLQCIPRSLVNAIQLILQNRKATYDEQVSRLYRYDILANAYKYKGEGEFNGVIIFIIVFYTGRTQFSFYCLYIQISMGTYNRLYVLEENGKAKNMGNLDAVFNQ